MRRESHPNDAPTQSAGRDNCILVPVSQSRTMRKTVNYSVREALNKTERSKIRFVQINSQDNIQKDTELLNRARIWAEEEYEDSKDIEIETKVINHNTNVSSPGDLAAVLNQDASAHNIDQIILDSNYEPGFNAPLIRPLEEILEQHLNVRCDVAPESRTVKRSASLGSKRPISFIATLGISFVFYQVLAGSLNMFDLVTGAITSLITAATLSTLLFTHGPTLQTAGRIGRLFIYIPVLFWEIVKANIRVAGLILRPQMPINPQMVRITPDVNSDLALTTLANSITLTPGTLSVRIDGDDLLIHAVDDIARDDLLEGGLERWTQYIFHGKGGKQ